MRDLSSKIAQSLLLTVSLCWEVFPSSSRVLAQTPPYRTSQPERSPGGSRCANLSVEPHISLTPQGGPSDQAYRTVDFTITVFVSNQCPEPVELVHGSFVSYQTNFPPVVPDATQPPECLGQQRSFSGTVSPFQKAPFVFRAQGCAFPSVQEDSPRVTLEAGSIFTEAGETPIPGITEVLP